MQTKHNTPTAIAMYSGNNVAASISIVAAFVVSDKLATVQLDKRLASFIFEQ